MQGNADLDKDHAFMFQIVPIPDVSVKVFKVLGAFHWKLRLILAKCIVHGKIQSFLTRSVIRFHITFNFVAHDCYYFDYFQAWSKVHGWRVEHLVQVFAAEQAWVFTSQERSRVHGGDVGEPVVKMAFQWPMLIN